MTVLIATANLQYQKISQTPKTADPGYNLLVARRGTLLVPMLVFLPNLFCHFTPRDVKFEI